MTWSPTQYCKFESERFAPFDDLVALLERRENLSVIDLGCGTGELTLKLAGALSGASVVGIDNSPAMLEKANANVNANVNFELRSIEDLSGEWDLIISNAAIHWVEDHPKLLEKLWERLKPGGQIAVQVPSGVRNKAQLAVMDVAEKEPFLSALEGWKWKFPVLAVHEYAEILYSLGGREIVAFEKVYPHILQDAEAVYNWVAGTTMTAYTSRLPAELLDSFNAEVLNKIRVLYLGSPVFFPFRRIFFSSRKVGKVGKVGKV
jgi:trans-aconitate 2-methyltransferase